MLLWYKTWKPPARSSQSWTYRANQASFYVSRHGAVIAALIMMLCGLAIQFGGQLLLHFLVSVGFMHHMMFATSGNCFFLSFGSRVSPKNTVGGWQMSSYVGGVIRHWLHPLLVWAQCQREERSVSGADQNHLFWGWKKQVSGHICCARHIDWFCRRWLKQTVINASVCRRNQLHHVSWQGATDRRRWRKQTGENKKFLFPRTLLTVHRDWTSPCWCV